MPDAGESSNWPALSGLGQLRPQLDAWLQANLQLPPLPTTPHLLLQLAAVLASLVAALLFARRLAPRTRRFVAARAADRQSLLTWLRPAAFPLLWIILLWFTAVALREAGAPAKLVEIALGLVAAWMGVRLVLSFVASLFWSRVIAVGIVVVAGLKALGLWPVTLSILAQMALNIGSVQISALGIIEATLILAIFWWAASLLSRRLDLWAERLPGVSPSERVLLGKLTSVLAWTFAVFIALHALGINVTTLAVFSGAVGLGVGFGLQKVVSNLISGVILLLDRSVKPGDVIAVGEHYGWINSLGARYVSVVTRDGIEHLIPNEDLITDRVENWSHSNNLLRLHAPVGIAYSSDLDQALALAVQAAAGVPRVLAEPPPRCLVLGFGDSSVDLELRFWINDPRAGVHNVRSDVLKRIWDLYHANGIELPFPQRDVNLKTAAALPVRMVDTAPPTPVPTVVAAPKEGAGNLPKG
ncbi:MAG: mechanosensitive ion channel [Rhodospirillales bacterium]